MIKNEKENGLRKSSQIKPRSLVSTSRIEKK